MNALYLEVDPCGTYLEPKKALGAKSPTSLSLLNIGIRAGDYISLEGVGSFSAGEGLNGITGMSACFYGLTGNLKCAPTGQESAIQTSPTWGSGIPTDIPEDFAVSFGKSVIVRVPTGATHLRFSATDSFFGDNKIENGKYGVLVSRPNHPYPHIIQNDRRSNAANEFCCDTDDLTALLREALNDNRSNIEWPEAKSFAPSPFSLDASYSCQYRGWYVNSKWNPINSRYNPSGQVGRKHLGVDIFAPRGSKLIVPLGPTYAQALNVTGYGLVIAFRFTKDKEKLTAIYAHCDEFLLDGNRIAHTGELVGTVGCSGNSTKENCGQNLETGGRTDHVHFGLYKGEVISDKDGWALNPSYAFPFKIYTPK